MTLTATVFRNKTEIIKEREGVRVKRWLHLLFGGRKFGFQWTNSPTSYTDGKDVFAKYDIVRPGGGPDFTEEEKRVIRKATSVHERGHIEYDNIEIYINWLKAYSSPDPTEWEANTKFPRDWAQFYGNVMLDGRMENLIVMDHPEVEEYIQFKNYHWKCAPMLPQDRIMDFRLLYMTRSLGMMDPKGLDPTSIQLIDSVQPMIEKARFEATTKACLERTLEIVRATWPTLMEWMKAVEHSPSDPGYRFSGDADDPLVSWGDPVEVEQNVIRAKGRLATAKQSAAGPATGGIESEDEAYNVPEGNDGPVPDCFGALSVAAKEAAIDEKYAEEENGPYEEKNMTITIEPGMTRTAFSATVISKPYPYQDLQRYQIIERSLKRDIALTSRVLKELCDPTPDEQLINQRSGKVAVNRMWRSEALGELNVFTRKVNGTAGAKVRIALMADISGSTSSSFRGTSSRIIDEIRKALILMTASCEKAGIPNAAFAFTEYNDTVIFPLKPYGRFGSTEKGFIGGIEAEEGNRDTLALRQMIQDMSQYKEDIRLVIMLSDGLPCFASNEDETTMRFMVQQAEKQGIDVLCLYCGPESPHILKIVQHMYPGGAIHVGRSLPRDLSRHVKRIIRKRR